MPWKKKSQPNGLQRLQPTQTLGVATVNAATAPSSATIAVHENAWCVCQFRCRAAMVAAALSLAGVDAVNISMDIVRCQLKQKPCIVRC